MHKVSKYNRVEVFIDDNYDMIIRNKIEINTDGTPLCPNCNHPMHWESDWNAPEVIDIDEVEGLSEDTPVGLWSCPNCGKSYYIFNDGDNDYGVDDSII